jgi:hypothetical protein
MEAIKDNIGSFSTAQVSDAFNFKNFMDSNNIVAKVAFIIMTIIVFMILLRVGVLVINYFFNSSKITLVNGMVNAKNALIYSQDPSNSSAVIIPRSNNQTDGIEFSWSCWIYINSYTYMENQYKHIFYKGNSNIEGNGLNTPNNAPGLYLTPVKNNLLVIMNTFNEITREVIIPNIPISKWVNIVVRCENTTLDVYINGNIARSIQLDGVPKQNDGDVYVAANGGFDGNISNLCYYAYGLSIDEINKIQQTGPKLNIVDGDGSALTSLDTDYLSIRWYV